MATKERNKIRDIIVGLTIFAAHGGAECDAQHDILHAGQADGQALSDAEIATLREHDWFLDSENCDGCAEDDDPPEAVFVMGEGDDEERHKKSCPYWAIFT